MIGLYDNAQWQEVLKSDRHYYDLHGRLGMLSTHLTGKMAIEQEASYRKAFGDTSGMII